MAEKKAQELGAQKPLDAEAVLGAQKLTEAEQALVTEAYGRLDTFGQGCREAHEWAREWRRIARMDDPRQDHPNTPAEQRTLQMQTLRSTLNHSIADQMDNRPEAKMIPERVELTRVADDLTDVVRFILDQNDFEGHYRDLVEDCFVAGTYITQVVWDEDMHGGQGDVAVLRWPIEALVWDPAAEDAQEARALIKVSWHPISWFAAHYPDAAPYIGAETYSAHEAGVPDAWARELEGDEPRARLLEYWYRVYDAQQRRYKVHAAFLAGGALLWCSEREKPEGVYQHGMYPFVVGRYTRIEGTLAGGSMVQELVPMQRYVNRYFAYFDKNLREASHTRIIVADHSGVDMEALADWNRDFITARAIDESSLHLINTPLFTGAAPSMAAQLQADMKQDSGQNQFNRGETAGGVTAASAISALQEAGGKVSRMRTTAFQDWFRDVVEQIVWVVAERYTPEHARLITGTTQPPRMAEVDAGTMYGEGGGKRKGARALPPPPYHVQIQVQRLNPLRLQAGNDILLQAAQMCMQAGQTIPFSVLFELLNVDGKDRVRELVMITDGVTKTIQGLQGQLQQAGQVIQQQGEAINNLRQALRGQAGGSVQSSQESLSANPLS